MKVTIAALLLTLGVAHALDSETLPEFDGAEEELVAAGDGSSHSFSADAEGVCPPSSPYLCEYGFCCPYSTCCTSECCSPSATHCRNGLCYRWV